MATTIKSYRPDFQRLIAVVDGPASYATGGFEPALLATAGAYSSAEIESVHINCDSTTYDGYYDHSTDKVVAVLRNSGAEVTATTDLSAIEFTCTAFLDR